MFSNVWVWVVFAFLVLVWFGLVPLPCWKNGNLNVTCGYKMKKLPNEQGPASGSGTCGTWCQTKGIVCGHLILWGTAVISHWLGCNSHELVGLEKGVLKFFYFTGEQTSILKIGNIYRRRSGVGERGESLNYVFRIFLHRYIQIIN